MPAKKLYLFEWDADVWGIGFTTAKDPLFYFGPEQLKLAKALIAAYNGDKHSCSIARLSPDGKWECAECGVKVR